MTRLKSVRFNGVEELGGHQVDRLPHPKLPTARAVLREDIGTVVVMDEGVCLGWMPWARCTAIPEDESKPSGDVRGPGKPSAAPSRTRTAK